MSHELIPIRLSHLLGYNGVGAIVRGEKDFMVVHDIRQWTDRQGVTASTLIPYVERVRAALGITQQLRKPPIALELDNGIVDGVCIPASRFPSWTRCPKCGALYRWPWRGEPPDPEPCCKEEKCKGKKLEQVTWVLAHPDGYLADVPWSFLAHKSANTPKQKQCKVYDHLQLIENGYERRILKCKTCNSTSLFNANERLSFGSGNMQPWTPKNKDIVPEKIEKDQEEKKNIAQILAINDSRVYAPNIESVLIIPPESRVRKGTVVDHLYRKSEDRARIDKAPNSLARKAAIRTLATEYRCTPADIEMALDDLNRGYPLYGEKLTPGQLRESEFKAFLEIIPDQRDDEDLVTRNRSNEWHNLAQADGQDMALRNHLTSIQNLIRVDRLKAIKVFKGFTRLEGKPESIVPPDIVGQSDWLPATELYGEGIFITLNESRLHIWEKNPQVAVRLNQLQLRFNQAVRNSPDSLTSRFMLLHTLSHLLVRQLEAEGGYPAASLAERLYCATAPEPMAGILIYIAVPDIAGSLGGLAELAEPMRFRGILIHALEHSQWCSLDPVCNEHEGQGPGLLNRAACHACALVPEPACEYGNSLLDRAFVKGDVDSGLPSFFDIF